MSGVDDSSDSNPKTQLPSQKEQKAKTDNVLPLAMNLKKMFGENPTNSSNVKSQKEKKAKDAANKKKKKAKNEKSWKKLLDKSKMA